MNPLVQKLETWQKHKKATSTFHHANYHYQPQVEKQKYNLKEDHLTNNFHKRAQSFSKQNFSYQRDFHKHEGSHDFHFEKMNRKIPHELKSQNLKQSTKAGRQKSLKQKKQDFIRDYIKSQSQTHLNKKKQTLKLDLKFAKLSPDNKSQSKSTKKLKSIKEHKSIKLKRDSQQGKPNSKEILRQKTSKDSKVSKNSNNRKSDNFDKIKKAQYKREIQNEIHREKRAAQINFKNTNIKEKQSKSNSYPMCPEQVADRFADYFNQTEINQMKQYKQIYFLGKNFAEKQKKMVFSARQSQRKYLQKEGYNLNQNQKNHQYFQTQNIGLDKKHHSQQNENGQFYKYTVGQHIAYRYEIISSINRGSFGEVLKVFDHKKKQEVAIKIVKRSKELVQQTFVQISILTHIKQNDKGNTSGIVRIKDFLLFRNHICIIFELLDGNLYELLTANGFKGFNEEVIRLFAVQILNSLNFLRKEKIIHCDLKPQNLVMKNWGKSGIKLIDFGTSCFEGKQMYSYLQSRYYRAPEVFMQMPYSYPIDMWSFGCMMAEFKIGDALFTGRSSIQQLLYICSCLGIPNKNDGLFSLAFLQNQKMKEVLQNKYLDFDAQHGMNLGENNFFQNYQVKLKKQCLMTLEQRLSKKQILNSQFYDFLSKILVWQPEKRLTPQEALRHPWITKGLSSQIYSLYSSFNTNESCSRQKKNSKDSKASNSSKPKSSRQKSNRAKKIKIIETDINSKERSKEKNKINFAHKKQFQQDTFLQIDRNQSLQIINESKKSKIQGSLLIKEHESMKKLK